MATTTETVAQTGTQKWDASKDPAEELVDAALRVHTKPLWTQMARLNPPEPNPQCVPHIWRYDEVRPSLLRAGELVSEQQAERRVLMLVNPARGTSLCDITHALADVQTQMPHIPQTHYTPGSSW